MNVVIDNCVRKRTPETPEQVIRRVFMKRMIVLLDMISGG